MTQNGQYVIQLWQVKVCEHSIQKWQHHNALYTLAFKACYTSIDNAGCVLSHGNSNRHEQWDFEISFLLSLS